MLEFELWIPWSTCLSTNLNVYQITKQNKKTENIGLTNIMPSLINQGKIIYQSLSFLTNSSLNITHQLLNTLLHHHPKYINRRITNLLWFLFHGCYKNLHPSKEWSAKQRIRCLSFKRKNFSGISETLPCSSKTASIFSTIYCRHKATKLTMCWHTSLSKQCLGNDILFTIWSMVQHLIGNM